VAIATIEQLWRAAAKYQDERLRAKIGGVAGSMPGTVHGSLVAMAEDEDEDEQPPEVGPGGHLTEEYLRALGKMEGVSLPSLQSSQGPESGQPAGGRPRPMEAKYEETESPRSIAGEAPGGLLEPGGHVSATRPAGTEPVAPMSGKMATPAQMKAALHYERDQGKGTPDEKAQKVADHLTERPTYYVELERMMDADMGQLIRRSVVAVTPGDLAKGAIEKVQDVAASRRAEKARKKILAEKKAGKKGDSGGWEKGPRGGMRKRVGGKWVYRGKTTEEGRAERGTGLKGLKAGTFGEEEPQHPPPSAEREAMMRTHPPEKHPDLYYESEGGKISDEHRGKEGGPMPGEPGHDVQHPDTPHDSHPTHEGKSLDEAIKHLDSVDPKMLRKRGEHIAEEIGRKDPEAAKRIKDAMVHLEHAVQIGRAKRERGQSTKKEDMTASEALKSVLRDFNAAAAPASVLGPELGGVLKADEKKEAKDASAKAAEEEAKKSLSFVVPIAKSGPYASGRWGPVPTVAPIAGSSPRDETPSLPDYQEIYYQPPSDERRQLEEEQELTRRLATAKRNTGVYGFHGTGLPPSEPVLHYVSNPQAHAGPLLSARRPLFEAKETDDQRRAGMPPPYGPEKDGSDIERKTDRGRTPRSGDRRDDEVPTVGGRPTPRDKADDEKFRAKMERHRNPRTDDVVSYLCDIFGIDEEGEEQLRKKAAARLDKSELFEELYKGARGGKYIKRVPYYKDGKRRYRYYYRESAVAREAKAGEEVRLDGKTIRVEKVTEGSVTITIDGSTRKLSRNQYTQLLARHYGHRFYDHAEKRAKQAMNAVFRHVPEAMLADLRGDTFEARMKDLRTRAPAIYAKLEQSFQRAGVGPGTAKRILSRTLRRRGWTPDARAAAIGSVLTQKTNAKSFHEILRGAENLAGGARVEIKHVGAVVELRGHDGPERKAAFSDEAAKLAARAETELMALNKLIMKSAGDDDARMKVLASALSSTALQKLTMLTTAFPGLRDEVVDQARDALLEAPSLVGGPPKRQGSETSVFIAGEGGEPRALKARYVLMEAGDVVASHDPTKGFAKHGDYPEGVQERAYHRDKAEQAKVIRNAQKLRPEFIVNTNPDAVNGPPLVTTAGHALGGNSRTMSVQLAYAQHPEKAAELRTYLEQHAHEVGFTTQDVAALKSPILVRVVDDPQSNGPSMFGDTKRKHTKEEMRLLVRQMNESFTQGMDPRTMQVAMGRKLDEATLKSLADGMQEGETLAQFLSSSRSEPFINALRRAGIIDQRNHNQYITKGTKRLNADGRTLVSRILVGRLVNDADILSETRPSTVDAVARATPHMMAAKAYGEGYDVSSDMGVALEAYNDLQRQAATGKAHFGTSLDPGMSDREFDDLFRQVSMFGDEPAVKTNPRAMLLLKVLIKRPGPKQMATVFKNYTQEAAKHPEGQAGLFGAAPEPREILERVVDQAIGSKK
jgi:hypothetical protein